MIRILWIVFVGYVVVMATLISWILVIIPYECLKWLCRFFRAVQKYKKPLRHQVACGPSTQKTQETYGKDSA